MASVSRTTKTSATSKKLSASTLANKATQKAESQQWLREQRKLGTLSAAQIAAVERRIPGFDWQIGNEPTWTPGTVVPSIDHDGNFAIITNVTPDKVTIASVYGGLGKTFEVTRTHKSLSGFYDAAATWTAEYWQNRNGSISNNRPTSPGRYSKLVKVTTHDDAAYVVPAFVECAVEQKLWFPKMFSLLLHAMWLVQAGARKPVNMLITMEKDGEQTELYLTEIDKFRELHESGWVITDAGFFAVDSNTKRVA